VAAIAAADRHRSGIVIRTRRVGARRVGRAGGLAGGRAGTRGSEQGAKEEAYRGEREAWRERRGDFCVHGVD
jgi:hypothetical protein